MTITTQDQTRPVHRVQSLRETLFGKFLLAVSASAFVALCAHVSLPLPFTPVPLTFSDFGVLLVGLALGPSMGFAALALYLLEGASGLPVFTPGGPGGVAQLLGGTGGYLFAYPFAAALAGWLSRRLASSTTRFAAALGGAAVASTLIMVCGTVWLGFLLHAAAGTAFRFATLPFIPGQVVKVLSAAGIFASLERWRRS